MNTPLKKWNERSIPACAGEPGVGVWNLGKTKVYPRVCGGTLNREALRRMFWGLSPRVRGNRYSNRGVVDRLRSIPAVYGEP